MIMTAGLGDLGLMMWMCLLMFPQQRRRDLGVTWRDS
jgi:hypothetical protein